MSQSLTNVYLHTIFGTKHRQNLIDDQIEDELFAYLGGVCNELDCSPVKIGGHKNHVHILSLLSKKVTIMKFLEELKSHSSAWMKKQDRRYENFYWQGGYGVFSVSPSAVANVKQYIEMQHDHHKTITFEEEYRAILREHNIDFDERYLWD